ncbi:MAG: uroporphyrinogen decarboxylase [Deltaproteobacteria bacterium]|nr:uroporphyrinogen decarboxylase [Deltaproteobacteria bacterium]
MLLPKDLFENAIALKKVDRTPFWMMRQAGRYQKGYRELREKYDFLTLCKIPELAAQVSLLPIEQFELDAVILFSDILTAIEPLGLQLEFGEKGPVIHNPIKTAAEVAKLKLFDPAHELKYVADALKIIKSEIALDGYPLIGFSGAPYTLCVYMVEGKTTKNLVTVRALQYQDTELFKKLLTLTTKQTISYLQMQLSAGADYVQLFDTWAGTLSREDYLEFAFPYEKEIISALQAKGGKVILYVNNSGHLLDLLKETNADVFSLDWRTDIKYASELFADKAVQGNLDPTILFASDERIAKSVENIFSALGRKTGHIFNLGHGVLPETKEEKVKYIIETVKRVSKKFYE